MKKIAQGIVRLRKLILTVAVLLLIPSAIGAIATRINYDILTYLPQDLDSMIGEVALEDDFHLASTGMITVEGLPTNELIAMKKEIEAVPGVTQTFWLSDVIDPNIPTAMLPADVQQFMFGKNDSTMLIVRFDAPSASDETRPCPDPAEAQNPVQVISAIFRKTEAAAQRSCVQRLLHFFFTPIGCRKPPGRRLPARGEWGCAPRCASVPRRGTAAVLLSD